MSPTLHNTLPAFTTTDLRLQQPAAWRRAGLALWSGFQAMSLARARAELMRQARLREGTDPALARQLREAAQHTR